jgi:hypothetical protein
MEQGLDYIDNYTDEEGTPVKRISNGDNFIEVKNPYTPVAGYENDVQVKDRPATGIFDPMAVRQERIANKMAEQEAIENGTVGDIRNYYKDQGHADMVIGQKWRTQQDYYQHLKDIGYKDDDREMGNALHDYTQSQSKKIEDAWSRLYYTARDTHGMSREQAQEYADAKVAKDKNDVLDSGFRKWLPQYMRKQGDVKAAEALEAMDMDVYTATDIMDAYDEAKEKNLLIKPKIDYVTRKDGTIAKKMVLEKYDAMGNKIEDPRQMRTNPGQLGDVMKKFNTEFMGGLPMLQLEGSLSDTNPSQYRNNARAYAENVVRKIAAENNVKESAVWQMMKMASKNQDMKDDDYKDMLVEQLQPEVKRSRENSLTESVLVDKGYMDAYSQELAELMSDKVGTFVPKTGKVDEKKKLQLAMGLREQANKAVLAEGQTREQKMEELLIDRVMQRTPSPDDDINEHRREIVRRAIKGSSVMETLNDVLTVVQAEEAEKKAKIQQAIEDKKATEQKRVAEKIEAKREANGDVWVEKAGDGMKDIAKMVQFDDNGNFNRGVFTALGYEYDPVKKIVEQKNPPPPTGELFDREDEDNRMEVDDVTNKNKAIVVNRNDKGKLTPKSYLKLYSLYRNGVAGSQAELDRMGDELKNRENLSNFISAYARSGIDFESMDNTFKNPPKLMFKRTIMDERDYRKLNSESPKLFKELMGANDVSSIRVKNMGAFQNMLKNYPDKAQGYLSNDMGGIKVKLKDKKVGLSTYLKETYPREMPAVEGLTDYERGALNEYPALLDIYQDPNKHRDIKRMALAIALANEAK